MLSFGDTCERAAAWAVSLPVHRALPSACPRSLLGAPQAGCSSLHRCLGRGAAPRPAMVGMAPASSYWKGQENLGLCPGEDIWMPQAASTTRGAGTFPLMEERGKARDQQISSLGDFSTGKEPHQNVTSSRTHPPPSSGHPTGHPTVPHALSFPGSSTSLPAALTSRNIFGSSCRQQGDVWPCPHSGPRNVEQSSPPTPGISDVFGTATAARPGWGSAEPPGSAPAWGFAQPRLVPLGIWG